MVSLLYSIPTFAREKSKITVLALFLFKVKKKKIWEKKPLCLFRKREQKKFENNLGRKE